MFSFQKKTPATAESANWLTRLTGGLARTGGQLTALLVPGGRIDEDFFEELETLLIVADVGMDATRALLTDVRRQVKEQHLTETGQVKEALAHALLKLLQPLAIPLETGAHKPFIIMLCGVNGAGKTTSIGKLAKHFQNQGKSVLLAAGDTFRAALFTRLGIASYL